jgi:2-amino-4-hydroxy-6-hydroxymethyldihydropteridine diphosphokinase
MSNDSLKTVTAYIGLGSNLDNPVQQIERARNTLSKTPNINELAFSSLYESQPLGLMNQPDYTNAVMAISTSLSPQDLLKIMQSIENGQGRIRTSERWSARTLDLDLLLYGELLINQANLTVPHPGVCQRAFVLYPLHEISPMLKIPGKGQIADLLLNCPYKGLNRLANYEHSQ